MFIPADVVRQAAAAVAEHRGLAEDWLNDAVKAAGHSGVSLDALDAALDRIDTETIE